MKDNLGYDELGTSSFTTSGKTSVYQSYNPLALPDMVPSEQNLIPSNISFCSPLAIPLCTKDQTIGTVTVQRGSDGKIYITYALNSEWYFTGLNLFTGSATAIPVYKQEPNVCNFPYIKTFTAPYSVQKYTYVLNNMPVSFAVAAFASVVRIVGNGVRESTTAWGNGCSGKLISTVSSDTKDYHDDNGHHQGDDNHQGDQHDFDPKGNGDKSSDTYTSAECLGGNWATFINYTSSACTVIAVEPAICSYTVNCFFSSYDTLTNLWRDSSVTVGGYTYSEQEGEAISNAPNNNSGPGSGILQDSKHGFKAVATLKLSHCDYTLSPILAPAVKTIEDWLTTLGKLSPQNLPTGNPGVQNAADAIDSWIAGHTCSIEE